MFKRTYSTLLLIHSSLSLNSCIALCHFRENESDCSIVQNLTLNGQNANDIPRGECLAMRGALVAIGTRSGAVYIYHIDGKWKNQVKGSQYLYN